MKRREMLQSLSCGFGYLALAGVAAEAAAKSGGPLVPRAPHFPARAKRVIFLFMRGGPSQFETFDYNPEFEKAAKAGSVMPSSFQFARRGQSGLPISDLFPNVAKHADDLCLLHGLQTDSPAHPQAVVQTHTGTFNFTRPSIGAWVVYGLGTENQDLPGFVTINPAGFGGAENYGSAFLPASFQGTPYQTQTGAIPNIANRELSPEAQRKQIDVMQSLNRRYMARGVDVPRLEGLIESYELAFRMQTAVPSVLDLTSESPATRKMYGLDQASTKDFGTQCLLARRLAEAGVRFIELGHGDWDHHNGLKEKIQANSEEVDQPIAALIEDLKQRGLLKDTLLVWGGEFGRTTTSQNGDGRNHNNRGYTMWMAGGGVKGGFRHGACDPLTGSASEGKIHLHDLHATILHLLGLDHTKLTYHYGGSDYRLTDIYGTVAKGILA